MANKKISQLSQMSPVPTGGLMILANSGVSRSVTVKDVAEAVQSSSSNTFTGLNDTPTGISGNMFAVGNPDGTGIVFSKNLHLGTGHFLDKRYGGTISGTVTMATGEKIQFANTNNFINSAGENLALYSANSIKIRSASGANIYQVGGEEAKVNFYTGYANEDKIHVIHTSSGKYISSGLNHYLNSDTDISGKIFQSGKEILTGLYKLKTDQRAFTELSDTPSNELTSVPNHIIRVSAIGDSVEYYDTGHFVGADETGILVGKNESGQFVGTGVSGLFAEANKTGSFIAGSGVPENISAKWSSTGVLTSGVTVDNGEEFYPNKNRLVSLGRNSNRWKDIQSERLVAWSTGSSSAGDDSWITAKSMYTGDAYAEFIAMNTESDGVMRLGVSSTGVDSRNVGSGNYYLYGEGGSGSSFIIGNKHDLLFFANTGISNIDAESISGGQNPPALKIHTSGLVTFSEAFTMPTGDGAVNTFLQTDGEGTVSWGSASQTFTGLSDTPSDYTSVENHIVKVNAAGNALEYFDSGVFVGENETGNLVGQHMTGHFADSFTGLSDVNTGVDGLPAGGYGTAGQLVVVNKHRDGLIYSGYAGISGSGGGGSVNHWTDLSDTPSSYAGQAGKILYVEGPVDHEAGIQFFDSGVFVGENQTGNFVDVDMTGNLVGIDMTGNLVDQDMTGILVYTGDTGNFVLTSETGNFVDTSMTGNFVDIDMTGTLVGTGMTGDHVTTGMTGILVGTGITGDILVGKNESGQFVGDHETGVFLTEQSLSGTYSTQFQIEVADNGGGTDKYYLSEITAGSHVTTGRALQPVINLNRGNTYKFKSTASAASHGFYIATQAGGGGGAPNEYTSGVTNSQYGGAGQNIYFRVPQNAPEKLYYESNGAVNMGNAITVWDDTGNFVLKSETGDFVDTSMTGSKLVGVEATGDFYSKRGGPISGDVSILGASGLYVSGDLKVQSGISYNPSYYTGDMGIIDWSYGNILFKIAPSSINYDFINVTEGQVLTMYVHNSTFVDQTPQFTSGVQVDDGEGGTREENAVKWPADIEGNNNPPKVVAKKTNVYTFVNINTGIFASYLTGYDYRT